ncbi:MAG TPA: NlpC/P60 family protein [Frankiaceae bacterium]|jgi:cell wall-associated NlpC family hydrolase|nr:NlpC/P60 family protein [Frankiaceae bacterium]
MRSVASRLAGVVLVLSGLAATTVVGVTGGGAQTAPDAAGAKVVAAAKSNLGDAYEWGANGPDAWDCSGLTSVLWRTVGGVASIPRTSRQQQAWAWPMRAADARPGDLVFFGNPVTHVGIYAGDGRIVDASSSKKGVIERAIWKDATIRYGRVPRPGVAKPVPPPAPKPSPSTTPSAKPSATPAPKASAKPSPTPTKAAPSPSRPTASPSPTMRPVPPAGHTPRTATTKEMAAFVAAARSRIGAGWAEGSSGPRYDAAGLVRYAWARAGLGALPRTAAGIERLARPVALRDLAVGDLVLYGDPAVHVGVYVGNGYMVDASKVLKKVSERRVFASETVRFARLPVPRR